MGGFSFAYNLTLIKKCQEKCQEKCQTKKRDNIAVYRHIYIYI